MKTKFYTGEGDKGQSNLGKKQVSKSSLYAEAVGALDEITSWLGVCRSNIKDKFASRVLKNIQESLFTAQAEVGSLGAGYAPEKVMSEKKIKELESAVEDIDRKLPSLKNFVIPGGSRESATLDFARALARRAERKVVNFHENETEVSSELLQFINRLSSALFALARYMNHIEGVKEKKPSYD